MREDPTKGVPGEILLDSYAFASRALARLILGVLVATILKNLRAKE
jgi:hypothetical protein